MPRQMAGSIRSARTTRVRSSASRSSASAPCLWNCRTTAAECANPSWSKSGGEVRQIPVATGKPDKTGEMAQDSNRREFLQAGAAALTTSLFTGSVKGANDRIRVAFIGTGRMGSANIFYCAQVPGFEIAAVCDVYPPALEKAEAQ